TLRTMIDRRTSTATRTFTMATPESTHAPQGARWAGALAGAMSTLVVRSAMNDRGKCANLLLQCMALVCPLAGCLAHGRTEVGVRLEHLQPIGEHRRVTRLERESCNSNVHSFRQPLQVRHNERQLARGHLDC